MAPNNTARFIMQDILICKNNELSYKVKFLNKMISQAQKNVELFYMYNIYYMRLSLYNINGKYLNQILNKLVNYNKYTTIGQNSTNMNYAEWTDCYKDKYKMKIIK